MLETLKNDGFIPFVSCSEVLDFNGNGPLKGGGFGGRGVCSGRRSTRFHGVDEVHLAAHGNHPCIDSRHGGHDPVSTQREQREGFKKGGTCIAERQTHDDGRTQGAHSQKFIETSRSDAQHQLVAVHGIQFPGLAQVVGLHGSHGSESDQFQKASHGVGHQRSGLRSDCAKGGAVALESAFREPTNQQSACANDARYTQKNHWAISGQANGQERHDHEFVEIQLSTRDEYPGKQNGPPVDFFEDAP